MSTIRNANYRLASAIIIVTITGCAEAELEPEVTTDAQALVWWHEHSEVAVSDDAYRGAPAWADDDSDAAGLELHYERKLSLPPLQGWWDKRNFSFRPFLQNPAGGSKRFLTANQLPGQPITLDYMSSGGYLLITRFLAGADTTDIVRIALNGSVLTAAAASIADERYVVPSPDAGVIADVRCRTSTEIIDSDGVHTMEPLDPAECTVAFLRATTLTAIAAPVVGKIAWPSAGQPPLVTARWTPGGELIVHAQSSAFGVRPGGTTTVVSVPACQGPQTSSSKLASDGRRIGVSWNQLRVVAADPAASDTFGCP